jgi:hypothetical protein
MGFVGVVAGGLPKLFWRMLLLPETLWVDGGQSASDLELVVYASRPAGKILGAV